MSSLRACVGDPEVFERDHWGRRPLLTKRSPGQGLLFRDLADLRDLDRIVTSLGLRSSNFRMVRGGQPLSPATYTKQERKRAGSAGDPIDTSAVLDRFHGGATIVLESLHRYWPPLTRFARSLELDLGHRVQVNAYITPPGSQGFAVHRDDHDVFVLQTAGSKEWTVLDDKDDETVLIDASLEEGDSLYIPRDFPHSAATTGAASAHLTVGILTHDAVDIAREVIKLVEDEPALKDRLPLRPAANSASLDETIERVVRDLKASIEKLDRAELGRRVTRRLMTTHQDLTAGGLEQIVRLDDLTGDSFIRHREGAVCVLDDSGDRLRVLLADRELEMPMEALEAMAFVARGTTFRLDELDAWLDEGSRSVLVKRLIREGLLEVVFDD